MSSASKGYRVQAAQLVALRLDYVSLEEVIEERAKQAKLLMQEPAQQTAGFDQWGRVRLYLNGATIDSGNPKWFTVIFMKDGVELGREDGPDDIPRPVVSRYGTSWLNTALFVVPMGGKPPFAVFVVDRLAKERYEYQILPAGAHLPKPFAAGAGEITDDACRKSQECKLAGRCRADSGKCVTR